MKKLLGILVLGLVLTFSSNGISGEMNVFKKKIKLPEDVAQGYKNSWRFCCDFDRKTRLTPDYAFEISTIMPSQSKVTCFDSFEQEVSNKPRTTIIKSFFINLSVLKLL